MKLVSVFFFHRSCTHLHIAITIVHYALCIYLAADAEFFLGDDGTISVDILADQIVEQATALTYESLQCAGSSVVLVVVLQVLCEVLDTD